MFVMDLVIHQSQSALASLSSELSDFLSPIPHSGVGKLILQRMPRILKQHEMPNMVIPPHLVSYQTIIQTAAAPTRTCETTKLITKGQAPLYNSHNLKLTHKNTVAND